MTTKKKAQGGSKGKKHDGTAQAAEALHALSSIGAFDFINNMLGDTIGRVSAGLNIGVPDKWGDPEERPTVEDFAAWLARVPPTFDPADEQDRRPAELYNEKGVQRNPLTADEAREVLGRLRACQPWEDEASSLLLLLLYALANEQDEGDRSAVYYDACREFVHSVHGIAEAFEADHIRTLGRLRKGGDK